VHVIIDKPNNFVLYILLNNTDDHLRNHGLLRCGSGWRLSPAFDINPTPDSTTIRATSVFFEFEKVKALAALKANHEIFNLSSYKAYEIYNDVSKAVKSIDFYATRADISKEERKMIATTIGVHMIA